MSELEFLCGGKNEQNKINFKPGLLHFPVGFMDVW